MRYHVLRTQKSLGLLLCLLLSSQAWGLTVERAQQSLAGEFEYLVDPGGELTLQQLLDNSLNYSFKRSSDSKPGTQRSPIWLKLELDFSPPTLDDSYYLFSQAENMQEIRLYRPDGRGGYSEKVTGNRYPVSSREVASPRYGFHIQPGQETQTVYIRFVGGAGSNNFNWYLVEDQVYRESARMIYRFDIACLSAIGALFFFNLLIALTLRKPEYSYYSAYIFFVMLALISLDGLGFYYLWPDYPALNDRALHSFNILSASMRLLTIVSFLGIASLAPRLYRAALGLLGLLALTFLLVNLLGVSNLPRFTAPTPWLIGIVYGFVLCGYAIHKQVKLAVPLLITLLVPTLSGITQALVIIGSDDIDILDLQIAKIGFVIHILMFSLCLAARMRIEAESRIHALHDNLTGLPGTTLLQERFQVAANQAQPRGDQIAVLFIDLDGFKAVNDQQGHAAGDQLLTIISERLQQQLRRTDTVARIGGDEFVVLLTQVKKRSSILEVANKLLQTVAEPCFINGARTGVSASIGIAMHPQQGEDLETLLKAADKAMYDAKAGGKNACRIAEAARTEVADSDQSYTAAADTADGHITLPPYSTV